jgi:hypothetical protein
VPEGCVFLRQCPKRFVTRIRMRPLSPYVTVHFCARSSKPNIAHLRRDRAHPCHICARTRLDTVTSALGLVGAVPPHHHQEWALSCHNCTGTGLSCATPAHICSRTGPTPVPTSAPIPRQKLHTAAIICPGDSLGPATSAPGLRRSHFERGSIYPRIIFARSRTLLAHLRWDCAHTCNICMGLGFIQPHLRLDCVPTVICCASACRVACCMLRWTARSGIPVALHVAWYIWRPTIGRLSAATSSKPGFAVHMSHVRTGWRIEHGGWRLRHATAHAHAKRQHITCACRMLYHSHAVPCHMSSDARCHLARAIERHARAHARTKPTLCARRP